MKPPYRIDLIMFRSRPSQLLADKANGIEWLYICQLSNGAEVGIQSAMNLAIGKKMKVNYRGQMHTVTITHKRDLKTCQPPPTRGTAKTFRSLLANRRPQP